LLIASGIKEIKYINDYKNDELVPKYLEESKVSIERI
jgi:deoxycytidylate deaminase